MFLLLWYLITKQPMLNSAHSRALTFPIKCQIFQMSHLRNVAADGSDNRLDVLVPLSYAEVQLEGFSHPATKPEAQPSVLTAALPRVALQCQATCGNLSVFKAKNRNEL